MVSIFVPPEVICQPGSFGKISKLDSSAPEKAKYQHRVGPNQSIEVGPDRSIKLSEQRPRADPWWHRLQPVDLPF
jgi:hypothetical protein